MPSKESIRFVTEHASFTRIVCDGAERFYPSNTEKHVIAKADTAATAVTMQGFAVYDTRLSSEYAVALCSTKEEASDYPLPEPEKQDEEIFKHDEETVPKYKPRKAGKLKNV